jgi:peroxiredoxin Q/BCP
MRSTTCKTLLLALAFIVATGGVKAQVPPASGSAAPDFQLQGATADSILPTKTRLSDLTARGSVIIAFYPADWSGGCTKEMCTMRDSFSDLGGLGTTVVGISGDYVYSHREWAKHLGLQFLLLSDHDHQVARAYGSYNPLSGYNFRMVFLVDAHGIVRYADTAYKAADPASFTSLRNAVANLHQPVKQ